MTNYIGILSTATGNCDLKRDRPLSEPGAAALMAA
jgi:hypothetical protein